MSDLNLNPLGNIYDAFQKILENMTIKYSVKAEKYETLQTSKDANEYLDAIHKRDTFLTYIDYTRSDYNRVGIYDEEVIEDGLRGKTESVPRRYRDALLEIRRQRAIDRFEEKNNYYRMLNGYPDVEDTQYFYPSAAHVTEYSIDPKIPVHLVQDHYNKIHEGEGDYFISVLEGTGYIDNLIKAHPDKEYLKYIGTNRIDLEQARKAKNFQILQLKSDNIKHSLYEQFLRIYEQCREYFVNVIYIRQYRTIIDYYDNFIAMCIYIMTLQQVVMRQISMGIKREYFDIFAIRALYQAYNIPYNLNIDEDTQNSIMQNLNLLIQNKSTNKVLYNIADLLGFTNLNINKYYLSREHKFDKYGNPIEQKIDVFRSDTGTVETVDNYQIMYDLYFQKAELKNEDFITSFQDTVNRSKYEDVIEDDPFWWEDQNLIHRVWETEYNFVESKYLGLSISYSLTKIMFENIMLIKLIMQKSEEIDDIRITLPRITGNTPISLFDVIILLVCLTACKHNLVGEIITIPTQVIHVLDYMRNVEQTDMLVDTFGFDFDYFNKNNEKGQKNLEELKELLPEDEYEKLKRYISVLSFRAHSTPVEKIKTLNEMYENIKSLYKFLNYHMTMTEDRKTYIALRTLYEAAFFSKEMRDIFTITGQYTEEKRTAWTYFEFLYHKNPKLYRAVFEHDGFEQWNKYLKENELTDDEFTYEDFLIQVELGEMKINYDKLIGDVVDDVSVKDEKIYFYVNHIISRLEIVIKNIQYMYLVSDSMTPLENLLMKLIRFFKSYTIDIISLETILLCDMKQENNFKLFDEIWYMEKWIQPSEYINLGYSDVVHSISNTDEYHDPLKLKDQEYYDGVIYHDRSYDPTILLGDDLIHEMEKNIEIDQEKVNMFDVAHVSSTKEYHDSMKVGDNIFSDKIHKLWYSSDDHDSFDEEPEEETE